jgi:hypothetical protein
MLAALTGQSLFSTAHEQLIESKAKLYCGHVTFLPWNTESCETYIRWKHANYESDDGFGVRVEVRAKSTGCTRLMTPTCSGIVKKYVTSKARRIKKKYGNTCTVILNVTIKAVKMYNLGTNYSHVQQSTLARHLLSPSAVMWERLGQPAPPPPGSTASSQQASPYTSIQGHLTVTLHFYKYRAIQNEWYKKKT